MHALSQLGLAWSVALQKIYAWPVFSHGQLYVALSRATARSNIRILTVLPSDKNDKKKKDKNKWYIYEKYCLQRGPHSMKGIVFCFVQQLYSYICVFYYWHFLYPSEFQVIEEVRKKWEASSYDLLTCYWLDVQIIYNWNLLIIAFLIYFFSY